MVIAQDGGGGGGTLIFSYRLGSFLGVPKIEFPFFFNMFWGVIRRIIIFWGMMILWTFWGSSQNLTIFRGYFYVF